jgi:hypothetical protein
VQAAGLVERMFDDERKLCSKKPAMSADPVPQATSKAVRAGGCLCGAVRYEADWPPLATVACHCTHCQKQSGSALSVIVVLPREGLTIDGELAVYLDTAQSGREVQRKFCRQCGSPVVTDTAAAQKEGVIFVKAGTLDDASDLAPTLHYWAESAQTWFVFPDHVAMLSSQ